MRYTVYKEPILSEALLAVYPRVSPPIEFLENMITAFDQTLDPSHADYKAWNEGMKNFFIENAGLLAEEHGTWMNYRLLDEGKYAFALLRYS